MKRTFCALLLLGALLLSGCASGLPEPVESPYAPGASPAPPSASAAAPPTTPPTMPPTASPTATPAPTADPAESTHMSFEQLVADDGTRDEREEWPPAGSYRVDVDLTNCVMSAYDASGNLVRQALCTVGAADTPTPEGTFTMGEDRRRFGYFEEHDCYAQYWSQIDGAIFFHSLLYENDGETLRMSSYENLGRASSHGCVRLTVPDAKWIYDHLAPGSTVNIFYGEPNDALADALALPQAPK